MENEKTKELEALKALYDFKINEMIETLSKSKISIDEFENYCSLFEKGFNLGLISNPLSCVWSLINAEVVMSYESDDEVYKTCTTRLKEIIRNLYSENLNNARDKLNFINVSSAPIYASEFYKAIDALKLAITFGVDGVDYTSVISKLKNVNVFPKTYDEHRKLRDAQRTIEYLERLIEKQDNNKKI